MSDWNISLRGGPRGGEVHAHPSLPHFLRFTTWDADGTTTDHFYGPSGVDQSTMTATYEPITTPESVLANAWEQGYEAGRYDAGATDLHTNPYKAGQ